MATAHLFAQVSESDNFARVIVLVETNDEELSEIVLGNRSARRAIVHCLKRG
jgi:hypothetical protein